MHIHEKEKCNDSVGLNSVNLKVLGNNFLLSSDRRTEKKAVEAVGTILHSHSSIRDVVAPRQSPPEISEVQN